MSLSRRRFLALGAAGAATCALHPERPLWAGGRAEWKASVALPRATQEVYGTTWNGRIVVAGGLRSGADSDRRFTTLRETAFFDPSTETWTRGPALPSPRHHIVLAEANGTVYGFGGFVGETLRNGFQFRPDFEAIDVAPNTTDAHRLILWAQDRNSGRDMATALFRAYFSDGRNVSAPDVLVDCAAAAGLDAEAARSLIAESECADAVREGQHRAQRRGITGVPCYVFGQEHAVMGAQSVEALTEAFDAAVPESPATE